MSRIGNIVSTISRKIHREGLTATALIFRDAIHERLLDKANLRNNPDPPSFYDVLLVNGCNYSVPHPVRYRVDHQLEQLVANGLTACKVDAWNLNDCHMTSARSFIFFRCPNSEFVESFIKKLKKLNKKVYFDIDDLVIDTKYTDDIKYLSALSPEEKESYDQGVIAMGDTLRLCGNAITSTERLAEELRTIVPQVFINRNVASDYMIFCSNRALFERDTLPFLSDSHLEGHQKTYWRWAKRKAEARKSEGTVIGYFSGSITHNDDFEMVLPVIVSVLEKRSDVRLRITGELDLPPQLEPFRNRILKSGFCDWQQLPELIASVDINIAPLTNSIFNEAKSENKWMEAALVKVPTVASNIGAFSRAIVSGETGVLCDSIEEWEQALLDLIDNPRKRKSLGDAANEYCLKNCTTTSTGFSLVEYIRNNQTPNLFMILPELNISGGVLVALRHCCFLQDAGFDVSLIDYSGKDDSPWYEFNEHFFPIVKAKSTSNRDRKILLYGSIDRMVATFWGTVTLLDQYVNIERRMYLVQNYETNFYEQPDVSRRLANSTYGATDIEYLTISKWCKEWLLYKFNQKANFASNGIDTKRFKSKQRVYSDNEKVRILIEGDCESYYKNVDEAFEIVDLLDRKEYEVWYVSYNGSPKDKYWVDKFMHKVPPEDMPMIYQSCHILLKTSFLESFSYPPLEMMATGGQVVVLPNEGNSEYIVPDKNCLTYSRGNTSEAARQIERIVTDTALRKRLYVEGIETAKRLDWESLRAQVVALYK